MLRSILFVGLCFSLLFKGGISLGSEILLSKWSGCSIEEQRKVRIFLDEVEKALPDKLIAQVGGPLTLSFISLDSSIELPNDPQRAEGKNKFSRILRLPFRWHLQLHRLILPEIVKGPEGARPLNSGHQNYYHFAKALIIHELSHAYDAGPSIQSQLKYLGGWSGVASLEPQFLAITGWKQSQLRWKKTQKDVGALRSPDLYEFKNPSEAFAVNVEYFLLDPEFECRRPAVFQYLKSTLGHDPFPGKSCHPNDWVLLPGNPLSDSMMDFRKVDLSRLYEVHFLFASQGEDISSRWGHAMFRLVLCNPLRKEKGPECLTEDIADHVVLSFRANVQELLPNPVKAVLGGYPSELFIMKMTDVIDEYTKDDLRDLISVPLKLTDSQKTIFTGRAIEEFWTYHGKYEFFTNNCATEGADLLSCCFANSAECPVSSFTPLGMYGQLTTSDAVDRREIWDESGNMPDLRKAEAGGYLFRSKKDQLQGAFTALLQDFSNELGVSDLGAYQESGAVKRRNAFRKIMSLAVDARTKVQISSRFYVLDAQILRLKKKASMKRMMEALLAEGSPSTGTDQRFQDWVSVLRPSQLVGKGYGIPLESELIQTVRKKVEPKLKELAGLNDGMNARMEQDFPQESAEIRETEVNLKLFLARIVQPIEAGNLIEGLVR